MVQSDRVAVSYVYSKFTPQSMLGSTVLESATRSVQRMAMEPDEIRAEVQRRKKRAADLGIREVLRDLIKHRNHYRAWLKDDPKFTARVICPDIILFGTEIRFSIGPTTFQLMNDEERVASDDWDSRRDSRCDRSRETVTLKVNGEEVFEFTVNKSTYCERDGPSYHEHFGEIFRFIEGPWVTEIGEFVLKAQAHSASAWKERIAPREAAEAEGLKKRFGL